MSETPAVEVEVTVEPESELDTPAVVIVEDADDAPMIDPVAAELITENVETQHRVEDAETVAVIAAEAAAEAQAIADEALAQSSVALEIASTPEIETPAEIEEMLDEAPQRVPWTHRSWRDWTGRA